MTRRVLVDATSLPAQRVGAGTYVVEIVRAAARRADLDVHVLCKRRDADELRSLIGVAGVHAASPRTRPSRLLWEQTVLPGRVRRLGPDVYHGPHYTLPPSLPCPATVVFHDPTFYTHPELHERAKVTFFRRAARVGIRRAARVIAVSSYARRGAIEHAGADPDRVDVVPLGVDPDVYRADAEPADDKLRARVGADAPYLLWVGALEPRKDVPTLVDAFAALVAGGADHRLVLAGPPAWGAAAIEDAIERSGVRDRIVRTGYVSQEEKVALYRGADCFVYPSIAEGFGLPVLEAMACGTPVVTTTGSAPEEVASGAATFVPPCDAAALREGMERALAAGRGGGAAGVERAAGYTWARTASATAAVWDRLAS